MARLGFQAVLQVRSGGMTGGGGEWTTVGTARDCTLNASMTEADATHRASGGFTLSVAAIEAASVEFELLWDDEQAAQEIIEAAYQSRGTIGLRVLDKPLDEDGEGLLCNAQVLTFTRREPLDDTIKADVVIKPTYSAAAPSWLEPPPPSYASAVWEPGGDGLVLTFDAPVALGDAAMAGSSAAAPVVFTDDTGDTYIVETFDNAVFDGNTVTIPAGDVALAAGSRIYASATVSVAGANAAWASPANAQGAPDDSFTEATLTTILSESNVLRSSTAATPLPARPITVMFGFKGKTDDDTDPVEVSLGIGSIIIDPVTLTETNTEYEEELDTVMTDEILDSLRDRIEAGFDNSGAPTALGLFAEGVVSGDTKAQIDAVWVRPVYAEDLANEKITILDDTFRSAAYPARPTQAVIGVAAATLTVSPS
jgi:hypothetical protein